VGIPILHRGHQSSVSHLRSPIANSPDGWDLAKSWGKWYHMNACECLGVQEDVLMDEGMSQDALMAELAQFRKEKERIRQVVGQVGGKRGQKRDNYINAGFIIAMVLLFVLDILRHLFHVEIPLPQMFSIELAVLLVSIKIIWMIHKGSKVEHFQFWVLTSIEFRLNDLSNQLRKIELKMEQAG
jgi:hypothetical protein